MKIENVNNPNRATKHDTDNDNVAKKHATILQYAADACEQPKGKEHHREDDDDRNILY